MSMDEHKTREELIHEVRELCARLAAASAGSDEPADYAPTGAGDAGALPAHQRLLLIQAAIDQIHEAVVITEPQLDPPGPRIVYVNPAFTWMTGYEPSEVIGLTPRILQGPRTERHVLDDLRQKLSRGERFEGQTINYRKDGQPFVLHWHIAPIRDPAGRITHWVAIQRDITEQKHMEQLYHQKQAELAQIARLSTMGEMATQMAHELNQPLTAISNYLRGAMRRLQSGQVDPAALKQALQRATEQAQRAGRIVHRLRDYVGHPEPRRSTFGLNALVRDVLELLEPELRQHRVRVHTELAEELPVLSGDSVQLEQAILNVVRNAIEAVQQVDEQRRAVELATGTDEKQVWLTVSDSGPGFDAGSAEQLFEPFYTTKASGMGMGLNISRSIVEFHGGTLQACSDAGGRACFVMRLPCKL